MNQEAYQNRPTMAAWNELAAAVGTAPKMAAGSYVGTGTYGSGGRITLTFDFEPKAIFISAAEQGGQSFGFSIRPNSYMSRNSYYTTGYVHVTWDSSSVSWYTTADNSWDEFNAPNTLYYYLVLG